MKQAVELVMGLWGLLCLIWHNTVGEFDDEDEDREPDD